MRDRKIIPVYTGKNVPAAGFGLPDGPDLYNAIIEIEGSEIVIHRRPGLKEFVDLGVVAPVTGVFWWPYQQKGIAISDGYAWVLNTPGGDYTQLTGRYFETIARAVGDDFGTAFYIADGQRIKKVARGVAPGSFSSSEITDSGAPQKVSHVSFMDTYLLANELNTQKCHRSDVGDPDSFSSNWFSAESKYDKLVSLMTLSQNVFLFGHKTVEFWEDTGADSPFSRVSGGVVESGTHAPYSPIFCGAPVNALLWVDNHGHLVGLSDISTMQISETLDKYLERKSWVDIATDFLSAKGHATLIMHMLGSSETIAYDFSNKFWCHWASANPADETFERWRGNCHVYASPWEKHIIGDHSKGILYELDNETYQDAGSYPIKVLCRTPWIDRGDIEATKTCSRVDFQMKRNEAGGPDTVTLYMRYRNQDRTRWSSLREITMASDSGRQVYTGSARQLGRYKSRQWEFWFDCNEPVCLYQPRETFDMNY